jgi:two-component system chemotaxis response regulator CheY
MASCQRLDGPHPAFGVGIRPPPANLRDLPANFRVAVLSSRPAVKILIVDDDPGLNRLLALFLQRNGCEVHSAGHAIEALELLERVPDIGMVITDFQMPHLDGIGFVQALREDPRRKDLPVVMITGYPNDQRAELSMRTGAAYFLPKPIDLDQLLALVKFAE